jgi:hypothetical protein
MTHTPGPWAITKGAYGALNVGPASLAHPGKEATHYALDRGRDLLAQRAADAALIAAAPDMLEALLEVSQWAEMQKGYPQGTFEVVRAAIAKAGKEP